jgi:hypothetical protein
MNASKTQKVLKEACGNYLGWDIHLHN